MKLPTSPHIGVAYQKVDWVRDGTLNCIYREHLHCRLDIERCLM